MIRTSELFVYFAIFLGETVHLVENWFKTILAKEASFSFSD